MLRELAKGLAYSKLPHDLPLNMDSDSLGGCLGRSIDGQMGPLQTSAFKLRICRSPSKLQARKEKGGKRLNPSGKHWRPAAFRGLVAILVISHDTCSDSLAKLFRACFCEGYRTIIARYVAKWVSHRCACETKYKWPEMGGVSQRFGELQTSLEKYRAIWGIAAIVSQYRAVWGH